MSEQHWQAHGACAHEDPELFYPESVKGKRNREWENRAKQVCHQRCPVQRECLAEALNSQQRHGVWGGTTEWERRNMHPQASPSLTQTRGSSATSPPTRAGRTSATN